MLDTKIPLEIFRLMCKGHIGEVKTFEQSFEGEKVMVQICGADGDGVTKGGWMRHLECPSFIGVELHASRGCAETSATLGYGGQAVIYACCYKKRTFYPDGNLFVSEIQKRLLLDETNRSIFFLAYKFKRIKEDLKPSEQEAFTCS